MKRHLLATYLSQAWVAVMGVAFLPVYIRYLGIEAYGLIGAFAVLYSILVLLDLGITPTLTREMSRFTAGATSVTQIRDLLRTAEVVAFLIAALVTAAFWWASDWLAMSWFKTQKLDHQTVARAVTLMGIVAALRFVESIYRGCVIGLQHLVLFSTINAAFATLRGLGAVGVLAFISPSIEAFFLWQGVISFGSLAALMIASYASLPAGDRAARASLEAVRGIVGFASGMVAITALSIGLTQVDKLLLTKLLPLSEFGRYSLAAIVAVSLEMLAMPALQAYNPRLAKLHAAADHAGFVRLYHQGAQLVSITAGSAAMVLIIFAHPFLALWTQDADLAEQTVPLLQVLTLGYLLNMLMWMPYLAQLAHGWTSLTIRVNAIALAVIAPALFVIVPRYGALGAAWVWTGLNATYVLVAVQFMYRRILTGERWRWYGRDIFLPIGSAALAALLVRSAIAIEKFGPVAQIFVLALAGACAIAASVASASIYRSAALRELSRLRGRVRS